MAQPQLLQALRQQENALEKAAMALSDPACFDAIARVAHRGHRKRRRTGTGGDAPGAPRSDVAPLALLCTAFIRLSLLT